MTHWEYTTINAYYDKDRRDWVTPSLEPNGKPPTMYSTLNLYGSDGWELVSANITFMTYGTANGQQLIFRRPKAGSTR